MARVVRSVYETPFGMQGLYRWKGQVHAWLGFRWQVMEEEWLREEVWRVTEDMWYMQQTLEGEMRAVRYVPTSNKVSNIIDAMQGPMRMRQEEVPCWLEGANDGQRGMNRDYNIAFKNVVVNVERDQIEVTPRSEVWFDPIMVPVDYEPEAKCPTWMRCLDQWSEGDEVWKKLLQQWMGYCLMPHRRHAKLMLFYGKVRAGKGTITKVIEMLLGTQGYRGTNLRTLANRFGLQGVQGARVLCVNEVNELENKEGEHCVQVLKSIIGQDRIPIDQKNMSIIQNVRLDVAPMIVSNEIPKLPNKGQGLSSKMLVLPFEHSFLDNPDELLIDKLEKELPGIASWAVQGAWSVEHEADRFKMPDRSQDAFQLYLHTNNPFDSFLEARFVKAEKGFVATSAIWESWLNWVAVNKVLNLKDRVARNMITVKLEQESSWNVRRHRPSGGSRGMIGLKMRREIQDEH